MIRKLLTLMSICLGLPSCVVVLPIVSNTFEMERPTAFVAPQTVAVLPPGSRVRIGLHSTSATSHPLPGGDGVIEGTVLVASPEGVALKNCLHHTRLSPFSGNGTAFIPVQWVAIEQVTSTRVMSLPPSDYASPQLDVVTNESEYMENHVFSMLNPAGVADDVVSVSLPAPAATSSSDSLPPAPEY